MTEETDPILILDKYSKGEITEKDMRDLYKKLDIKSCFTCEFQSKFNTFCTSCIRYPIPRNKDYWKERK